MFGTAHVSVAATSTSAPSPAIRAQLMGVPEVRSTGRRIVLARQQNRMLFYLLAARLVPVSRDALYVLLWPEADECQARRALTQALTQLRACLPGQGALVQSREAVWLDRATVWSDVAAVDGLAVEPPAGRSTADLEALVALCGGRFLEGMACAHRLELEDWVRAESDRLERLYLEALSELCRRYCEFDRIPDAICAARRYLCVDPYDERMHRRLLALFAADGDRNAAIVHYRRLVAVLDRELGVAPEPATRAAYGDAMGERVAVMRSA